MALACKDCGTVGEPKTAARGSMAIEILLWLCFIVPGLLYSFWRLSSKQEVCRACGSANLVPLDTPVGKRIADDAGVPITQLRPSTGAVSFGRTMGRLVGKVLR